MRTLMTGMAVWMGLVSSVWTDALVNRSFEDPADPHDAVCPIPDGWSVSGVWMRRETGWAPRHWGACMMAYHHWRVVDATVSEFMQDLPDVGARTTVRFSVFICRDADANFKRVELRLEPRGGGKALATAQFLPKSIDPCTWQILTVEGRTADATGLRVIVSLTPAASLPRSGAVKFDDCALETGSARNNLPAAAMPGKPNKSRKK